MGLEIKVVPVPGSLEQANALVGFWEEIFRISFAEQRDIFQGREKAENHDVFWVATDHDRIAATSHVTQSAAIPSLGGLGEIAVHPDYRGHGLAKELCRAALAWFEENHGETIFLATGNDIARKLYASLGWQAIPNSAVMLRTSGPADFFRDYFREFDGVPEVRPGGAADRIPMIPLILSPHRANPLDANIPLYSVTHAFQPSCMGLYPQYERLQQENEGGWFSLYGGNRLLGLSSWKKNRDGGIDIDGFVHDGAARWRDYFRDECLRAVQK